MSSIPIYESTRTIRAPVVNTEINQDANEIIIKMVNKKESPLLSIIHPLNTDIDILQILDFIEEKAKKSGIKRVQWQKKDLIFTYITIENLKNAYLQQQRKLKIVLIDPIREVSDPLEREKILRDAHINSQTNQHYNRTQTITRLQSQFYWKCMTLHAGLFLKACEICNKNKTRNQTPQ